MLSNWQRWFKINLQTPCPLCAVPFEPDNKSICQSCYDVLPWVDNNDARPEIFSAFYYESPIDQLILTGKQAKRLDRLQLLAELITPYFIQQLTHKPQAILPVPLHTKRLRERGFNQALELTRLLAKQLNIPLLTDAVIRQRHTSEQKYLAARERTHNLQHAFACTQPLPYQHVAIFDDVVTTGATTQALAELLQTQGVATVQIWCIAKTKQRLDIAKQYAIDYDTASIMSDDF